jgi:hypothetical protein
MSTSTKSNNARRRQSYIEVENNPIEVGADTHEEFQLESLADAVQITKLDLGTLINILTEQK